MLTNKITFTQKMGRKVKSIELNIYQRAELEEGYKTGRSIFSKRCHMILLKSESKSSKEVASLLMTNEVSVNQWLARYKEQGIEGLKTKSGQGRKPILNKQTDEQKVKAIVKKERQRLKLAKTELESDLNKQFSLKTLKRFLKKLTADGNASD